MLTEVMSLSGQSRLVRIICLCGAYAVAGPAIILLNKHILTNGFPYPYTLTSMGLLCSWIMSGVFIKAGYGKLENPMTPSLYLKNVMPIGACQALAMGFGTFAYLRLTVAFIQMLKAFTPVITLVVLYLLKVETPSARLVLAVVGISVGTLLAVAGEAEFDITGFTIHEISAVAEALRVVLTQRLLQGSRFSLLEGLFYMAPAGMISMMVLIILFEAKDLISEGALAKVVEIPGTFLLASMLGFALNVLSFGILQLTSSVLLKGIAVARTAGLVIFCAAFLGESISMLEGFGYMLSLACFVEYNRLRILENKEKEGVNSNSK
eukprot:m.313560 g.313560  ORF g.313560 m.313560 type:complete len:322 (+) comp16491_c3_seq2:164-1129(+)